ncbi:hypothetical protein Q4577_08140 [Marinovum sp. 2_MG-2023]|uniref:hypothetical protein n=1 Tax=Roseobacteraceae TaxID=2854170 RepID=UPI001FD619E2|nr:MULTISPECIES: hypothetical protein [Roseobacteraceae]MCJ7872766.1 hypothetical protein [Phaeobacter sp. J2-8]MDO6729986.1 hypothetical protein [Marinovum sp. 2_MG-2023]MDO6779800.1 hypothetical protein [Marinovum sp. 1_MG-2023]
MKKAIVLAAVCAAFAAPAMAGGKHKHSHHGAYGPTGTQIVVSCFRGPWNDVIWDRPNPVFIDSLVAIGYDFPNAHAIAERVCRDPALVGNPEGLKSTMLRIYYDRASHRKHNY